MSEEVKNTAEAAEAAEAVKAEPVGAGEATAKEYTVEDIQKEIKPLSGNAFVRFWQKIWRWWLGVWYGFADKHPKGSSLIYKIFFLVVFSEGVTIWQFIVMTFLPYAFTGVFPKVAVGWPNVPMGSFTNNGAMYAIFGDTNGWGYFLAFEIAVFTAQCINFPLQRNITYRSHGNPYMQAMWYFIGWVLVSVFTNAVWGVCNVFFTHWGWYLKGAEGLATIAGLIKTVITGGVSIAIFFFIFLVIFPDNNKMAKSSKAAYDKLVANNAPTDKLVKAENKMKLWEDKAAKSNAESEYFKAKSQVNAAVMKYNALVKASNNEKLTAEQKAEYPAKIDAAFETAVNAINAKYEKEAAFNAVSAA